MNYTQLTCEQRYQIYALKKAGQNQREIAAIIGVHKSTISREVRRNQGRRGYRPRQAQQMTEARQQRARRSIVRITAATWSFIEALLCCRQWSPEQISGWLRLHHQLDVSHERIYQYIYADKLRGGTLYLNLRSQKKRRKRYGSYDRRGREAHLGQRRSIEQRPVIVDLRKRIGDWEADTIIGRNHRHAILSVVERKSKLTLLRKIERKTADAVERALVSLLEEVGAERPVHTITSDNGLEFARHRSIEERLQAKFYFAHPYASWERGLNENTNGLVRQYFPKSCDFSKITDEDIEMVMQRLNHRPRMALGFRTPHQVFFKEQPVALQT